MTPDPQIPCKLCGRPVGNHHYDVCAICRTQCSHARRKLGKVRYRDGRVHVSKFCTRCYEHGPWLPQAHRNLNNLPMIFDDYQGPPQLPPRPHLTDADIDAGRSPAGGWTMETLNNWGIPWPPPKGWKKLLTHSPLTLPTYQQELEHLVALYAEIGEDPDPFAGYDPELPEPENPLDELDQLLDADEIPF